MNRTIQYPQRSSSVTSVRYHLKKRCGVEYQLYPLDNNLGHETIHKREKGLLKSHILALLFKLNALQTKNHKTTINYKQMEVLNHILALQSHKIMVHGKRIKGVIHINVMLQNINTAYKYLDIIQDKIMLDYKLLNEYAVLPPQTLRPGSLQNESDIIIAEITNTHNRRYKYPSSHNLVFQPTILVQKPHIPSIAS